MPSAHGRPLAQDGMRMLGWIFNYWYVGTVLLLFLNFYVQTYILKGSKPSKKKE